MSKAMVGIIMGSSSDLPVMREAAEMLTHFGVPYELAVVSAHRTPETMIEYAKTARDRGLKVVIAGAGGAIGAGLHQLGRAVTSWIEADAAMRREVAAQLVAVRDLVERIKGGVS